MGISYFILQTFMNVYLGWSARYLNAQGMCAFDSPEFRQALAFYTGLYTKDKVTPPDSPVYDNLKLEPLWAAGKLAMLIDGL
jgi:multiple sugar transport system substrate-binding protein